MKFSAKEDIEAPVDQVFAALMEFDNFERAAMRRGADVVRNTAQAEAGPGMGWNVEFPYRGKQHRLAVVLASMDRPQQLVFNATGEMVEGALTVDLTELGPKRTRMTVSTEMKPRTLAARLFMQTLRLAKGKITRRFGKAVASLAADIEDRYKRGLPRRQ